MMLCCNSRSAPSDIRSTYILVSNIGSECFVPTAAPELVLAPFQDSTSDEIVALWNQYFDRYQLIEFGFAVIILFHCKIQVVVLTMVPSSHDVVTIIEVCVHHFVDVFANLQLAILIVQSLRYIFVKYLKLVLDVRFDEIFFLYVLDCSP